MILHRIPIESTTPVLSENQMYCALNYIAGDAGRKLGVRITATGPHLWYWSDIWQEWRLFPTDGIADRSGNARRTGTPLSNFSFEKHIKGGVLK